MKRSRTSLIAFLTALMACGVVSMAQERASVSLGTAAPTIAAASTKRSTPVRSAALARIEGEKRFRQNCGRCHMAPLKFPPRVMATVLRHMRVRATLADEDARLILQYLTE